MQLKQLFADEDAVSPVIGVILMVAITVILAAVIGTFVLGLGENVQDSAPQANFQFEYGDNADGTTNTTASSGNTDVKITHTGGEDVDADTVTIQYGSNSAAWNSATLINGGTSSDDTISTGDSATQDGVTANTDVRVIWTSPSGGNSNTIGQSTVPS